VVAYTGQRLRARALSGVEVSGGQRISTTSSKAEGRHLDLQGYPRGLELENGGRTA